jgi:hypothetical protein
LIWEVRCSSVAQRTTPLRRRRAIGLLRVRGCKECEVRATRENEMRKEERSINERKRNEEEIKRELKERQGMLRKGVR